MNTLHPVFQKALAPFAPPPVVQQEPHEIAAMTASRLAAEDRQAIEANDRRALLLQIKAHPEHWL